MALVVPTVLASAPDEYTAMMEQARSLSPRVHVDICDGKFADTTTVGLVQVHVPENTVLDLHMMVEEPAAQLETALSLHPHLIIFHAESKGDLAGCMKHTRELGVKVGLALLQSTAVLSAEPLLKHADHALIFTGRLGHNAGTLQAEELAKAAELRRVKPDLEISVDGGVNGVNAALVAGYQVDILYVGAYLQRADDPKEAFKTLAQAAAS